MPYNTVLETNTVQFMNILYKPENRSAKQLTKHAFHYSSQDVYWLMYEHVVHIRVG